MQKAYAYNTKTISHIYFHNVLILLNSNVFFAKLFFVQTFIWNIRGLWQWKCSQCLKYKCNFIFTKHNNCAEILKIYFPFLATLNWGDNCYMKYTMYTNRDRYSNVYSKIDSMENKVAPIYPQEILWLIRICMNLLSYSSYIFICVLRPCVLTIST